MTNPTSNFGWQMPTNTDLVSQLPADFEVFGQAVDTSLADLKGGTTGQVLAKASGTDMDFTWTAIDPLVILDAKGDLISATAADTPARLAVGANNTVLTADSSTATGLKWAAPSAATISWTLLNAGGTALTGAATITVSGISGKNNLMIIVNDASSASALSVMTVRLNSDTASNYSQFGSRRDGYADQFYYSANSTSFILGRQDNNAGAKILGTILLSGTNSSDIKIATQMADAQNAGASQNQSYNTQGFYSGTSAISSVSILSSIGNFDAGTIYIYGA